MNVDGIWKDDCGTCKELTSKLESAQREILDLRRLMGHWSTVELALKAQAETNLQIDAFRKALTFIATADPADVKESFWKMRAAANEAMGFSEKRSCSEVHPQQDVHHPEGH